MLSAAQVQQFDRQIRVWGFEAQQLLVQSTCLIHNCSRVHQELCKNLTILGINVYIKDDRSFEPTSFPVIMHCEPSNSFAEWLVSGLRKIAFEDRAFVARDSKLEYTIAFWSYSEFVKSQTSLGTKPAKSDFVVVYFCTQNGYGIITNQSKEHSLTIHDAEEFSKATFESVEDLDFYQCALLGGLLGQLALQIICNPFLKWDIAYVERSTCRTSVRLINKDLEKTADESVESLDVDND